MGDDGLTVRRLRGDDAAAFRALRLEALRSEGGMYCATYDDAAELSDAEWRERLDDPDAATFGAFEGTRLVGIATVFVDRDADPETATLAAAYVVPEHRRRGLSRRFHEARRDWVREHPAIRRMTVSHRRGNEASRRAIVREGFVETGATPRRWPDGAVEDEVRYELSLPSR